MSIKACLKYLGCNSDPAEIVQPPEPGPTINIEAHIQDLLYKMSRREKIMQIGQIDKAYILCPSDITKYELGSVISGGSGQPFENSPKGFADMIDGFQKRALKSRLRIPLLYGGDAVHGFSLSRYTVIMPHNIGLGAAGDENLVERLAAATALETTAAGLFWLFAPCLAVVDDCRWGRCFESFGDDPQLVARLGAAHIRGLQRSTGQDRQGREKGKVAACAKHFVGDGGTAWGSGTKGAGHLDRGDCRLEEHVFRERHLRPYVDAIKAGVLSIMVSFTSFHGKQMHGSHHWLTEVLRGEMGFRGLILSDWGGHNELWEGSNQKEKLALSINAGVDLIMIPEKYRAFLKDMEAAMSEGLVSEDRLNEAVSRVLRLKHYLGLFHAPYAERERLPQTRCAEHLALAREAAAKSCVLLKNRGVLPLNSSRLKAIHVCGKGANDVGLLCGGWSCSWQGKAGAITEGTTILQGLAEALPDTHISYQSNGSAVDPAVHQAVIVVLAEDPPYSEWFGDIESLNWDGANQTVLDRVTQRQAGIPIILIMIAGRPRLCNFQNVDAVLMGWLPGSEGGGGIADILTGVWEPTAKMPLSLPRALAVDEESREMFERGVGLTYSEAGSLPQPTVVRRELT